MSGLEAHLEHPHARGAAPAGAHSGAAGGAACGDLVRLSVRVRGERVAAASFDASGCAAALAAGSAAAALADGVPLLEAARLGAEEIAAELGGLIPAKRHAAELAADALHRALGAAVAADAACAPARGRTLVAMSGGVDSAVAALECTREDADVVAVTLELWADPENDGERSCCSAQAVRGARSLAHSLGLPHLTLDLRDEFRAGVVQPFLEDHADGLTPNPCVRCNGHVRLDAMLDLADRVGAERLATGHYARLAEDGEGPLLRSAVDAAKDQAYMLSGLAPASLARMRFPLGELTKPEVRARAAAAGLPVASKPDSQDLCFLAGTDQRAFLRRHGGIDSRPGEIVDRSGHGLGRHRGHHGFTVGQRRGLGVGGGEPLYVLAKDAASGRVVAGPREALLSTEVAVRGATLHRDGSRVDAVRLRYRSQPVAAHLAERAAPGRHGRLTLELEEPFEAAAPGQSACLLEGDVVVGWATIAAAR